jgi:Uma2 family endonuclease
MNIELNEVEMPIRLVPSEPVSIEEFWRIGLENPDLRLEREPNGDLTIMTPTTRGTGFRSALILRALGNWAEADGRGYEFDSSTAFLLPDGSVRSPDASWIRRERWSPAAEDRYDTMLCPEFVIELRSKSDRLQATRAKMQAWIDNGAELAWLVDPERKAVEVYRPGRAPEVLEGVTAVYGEGPVGGFVLELARVWG